MVFVIAIPESTDKIIFKKDSKKFGQIKKRRIFAAAFREMKRAAKNDEKKSKKSWQKILRKEKSKYFCTAETQSG